MKERPRSFAIIALAAALLVAGCDEAGTTDPSGGTTTDTTTTTVAVTGVTLDKSSATIALGASLTLVATIAPSDATKQDVTWSTSDASVASVTSAGVVTGKKAGNATITATSAEGGKTAGCAVTVMVPVSGLSLNAASATIARGSSLTLVATLAPSGATKQDVTWSTSDASVASVTSAGVVTALKVGSATITATSADGGKTASCAVTVMVPVSGLNLSAASAAIARSASLTLIATVAPSDATKQDVTWSSSDESVASVTSAGVVTGKKAGSATITATSVEGGKTASCAVTVMVPVSGLSLSAPSATIALGANLSLVATVVPSDATKQDVAWSTSDASIASVTSAGVVTGLKVGSATITATSADGGKVAACAVTVCVPVSGVSLNVSSETLCVGGSAQLVATIAPSDATDQTVTWVSTDPTIAKVTSTGLVSGVAVGSATITATSQGGQKAATCAITVSADSGGIGVSVR